MYYTVYTRLTTTPASITPATVGRVGDATVPESGRGVEEGSAMSLTLPTTLQSRLSGMGRVMVPASNGDREIHRVGSVSRSPRVPARRIGRPPLSAMTVSCCGPDFIPFVTPGTLTRRPPYRSSCLTTPAGFIPLRRFGLLATLGPSEGTWHPKISMMPTGGTGRYPVKQMNWRNKASPSSSYCLKLNPCRP
jgi:hypothetical protein